MAYFITEKCIGCSICEIKCPTDTIVGEKKGIFQIISDGCIDCGTCGIWCPADAIEDSNGQLVKGLKVKDIPKAIVDEDACISCEYCVDACPFDCITMEQHPDGQYPELAVVDTKKCVGCRLCEEACLWEAIFMEGTRNAGLSQTPLKATYVDKLMPSDATISHRDDQENIAKKSLADFEAEKQQAAS